MILEIYSYFYDNLLPDSEEKAPLSRYEFFFKDCDIYMYRNSLEDLNLLKAEFQSIKIWNYGKWGSKPTNFLPTGRFDYEDEPISHHGKIPFL